MFGKLALAWATFFCVLLWCGRDVDGCGEDERMNDWIQRCHSLLLPVAPSSGVSLSIPGSAWAIFLKSVLTLCPAFADVSMNITLNSWARFSASSVVTCLGYNVRKIVTYGRFPAHLLSFKSVLLPTNTMITSFPRSARTSSTHLEVFWKDARSSMVMLDHNRVSYSTHLWCRIQRLLRMSPECMMESASGTVPEYECLSLGFYVIKCISLPVLLCPRVVSELFCLPSTLSCSGSQCQWWLGTCCRRCRT